MICKNTKEKNAKIKQMKKKINKQKTNKKHKDYKLEALQIKVNRQTCDVWSCKLKTNQVPNEHGITVDKCERILKCI